MPDIHITREHSLGLPEARKLAFKWAEAVEEKFDMECTYEEGHSADLVSFTRSGVNGELKVTKDSFELDARLEEPLQHLGRPERRGWRRLHAHVQQPRLDCPRRFRRHGDPASQ